MSNRALSTAEAKSTTTTLPVSCNPPTIKQGTYQLSSTTLEIKTDERVQLQPITETALAFVQASPIRDGLLQISSLHTTAGILLNETQDALLDDVRAMLEQVIPQANYYKHNDPAFSDCDRKNADAHLRAVVVGHSLSIPIEDGQLKLGTWQQILFAEFDGPNLRKIHLQAMGI